MLGGATGWMVKMVKMVNRSLTEVVDNHDGTHTIKVGLDKERRRKT